MRDACVSVSCHLVTRQRHLTILVILVPCSSHHRNVCSSPTVKEHSQCHTPQLPGKWSFLTGPHLSSKFAELDPLWLTTLLLLSSACGSWPCLRRQLPTAPCGGEAGAQLSRARLAPRPPCPQIHRPHPSSRAPHLEVLEAGPWPRTRAPSSPLHPSSVTLGGLPVCHDSVSPYVKWG